MEIATWKYKRNTEQVKKHHCYVCPRCEREVDTKENFCPRCGQCFSQEAYDEYNSTQES